MTNRHREDYAANLGLYVKSELDVIAINISRLRMRA
jgi:hypothetical protein